MNRRRRIRWDKNKVIEAIHSRRDQGLRMNARAVQRSDTGLAQMMWRYFGSYDAALRAAGIDPTTVRRRIVWDQAMILDALRERQSGALALNADGIRKSNRSLGSAMRAHFGSHDDALRAAGIDPSSIRRRLEWDKAAIVAALRARHQRSEALYAQAIYESDKRLYRAIRHHFGTTAAALVAVGLDPASVRKPPLWDRAIIVAALRDRRDGGLGLYQRAIVKSDGRLASAIAYVFPSFDDALRAAGIDPGAVRPYQVWSKAEIAKALLDLRDRGMPIHAGALAASNPRLTGAIHRHFGSHDKALVAAGIDPATVRCGFFWDRAKVIAALQERHAAGQPLNIGAIQKSGCGLANAIRNHFPSHDEALRAAGFEPAAVRLIIPWDKEMVVDRIRRRREAGEPLSTSLMKRDAAKLHSAAIRAFGTYRLALEAAGIDPETVKARSQRAGHWTEELVLQTLRDLHRDGHDLRYRRMKEHSQPLFFAAKTFFGSYVNAVREAGINYWEMSQLHLARERVAGNADPAD